VWVALLTMVVLGENTINRGVFYLINILASMIDIIIDEIDCFHSIWV